MQKIVMKVILKMVFGRKCYYPNDTLSQLLISLDKKKAVSLTEWQIQLCKEAGIQVEIEERI